MLMKINRKTGTLHSNEKAHLLHTLYEQLTQGWKDDKVPPITTNAHFSSNLSVQHNAFKPAHLKNVSSSDRSNQHLARCQLPVYLTHTYTHTHVVSLFAD